MAGRLTAKDKAVQMAVNGIKGEHLTVYAFKDGKYWYADLGGRSLKAEKLSVLFFELALIAMFEKA